LNDPVVGLCFFDVRVNSRRETVNNYTPFVHGRIVVSEFVQHRDEIFDCSQPDVKHASSIRLPRLSV